MPYHWASTADLSPTPCRKGYPPPGGLGKLLLLQPLPFLLLRYPVSRATCHLMAPSIFGGDSAQVVAHRFQEKWTKPSSSEDRTAPRGNFTLKSLQTTTAISCRPPALAGLSRTMIFHPHLPEPFPNTEPTGLALALKARFRLSAPHRIRYKEIGLTTRWSGPGQLGAIIWASRGRAAQLETVRRLECPREGKNEACRLPINLVDFLRILYLVTAKRIEPRANRCGPDHVNARDSCQHSNSQAYFEPFANANVKANRRVPAEPVSSAGTELHNQRLGNHSGGNIPLAWFGS